MFEREGPEVYPCDKCKYFKRQFIETDLNIEGVIKSTVVWFPSCRYYLGDEERDGYISLFLTTGRCKKFRRP